MKVSFLLVPAVFFLGVSCERHEFEGPNGTKQMHEHHKADHGAGHETGHGAADSHGEADKHGEEKPHAEH